MYVIAGLGNPGRKYENTRHNVGFDVIDLLAEQYNINMNIKKHRAVCGTGVIEGVKALLVKPQTFMNLSGESIGEAVRFYKIDETSRLIVVSDDISLDVGQLRMRKKGSAGGHNGLKNIISHLGSEEFMRIRIGVGDKPAGSDLVDYVLGSFSKEEKKILDETKRNAVLAIETIISDGIDKAMNLYNTTRRSPT